MRNKLHLAIISYSVIATPTFAEDLNINGFLSVGASMMDNDKVAIAGHDNQGGFKQDNILGLQVSKQVNQSTTVTGQLVSRGSDDYKTESAWAYVSHAANDDLDLRMGRIRVPFYFYSDFLEVGYAYDWIRPPFEVYNIPFSSLDGADATYRFSLGDFDNSAQVYYGRYNPNSSSLDLRNFTGIVLTSNLGNMTYRASYHQTEIESKSTSDPTSFGGQNAGLAAAISAPTDPFGLGTKGYSSSEITKASEDFTINGQLVGFYGVAAAYDNGEMTVIGEYTSTFGDLPFFPVTNNYLVKVGKRLGDFTPHLTYSATSTSTESGIEGDIQESANLESEENSITLGLRYDYDLSTALKFEVQQNNEDKRQGVGKVDESGILYSVAIDLVF